jgi:hypothetical protein
VNTYGYAGGNPVQYIDPDGRRFGAAVLIGIVAITIDAATQAARNHWRLECIDPWQSLGVGLASVTLGVAVEWLLFRVAVADSLIAAGAIEGADASGTAITEEGLNTVTSHLAQFGDFAPNQAMIDRLTSQLGSTVTGADENFYTHELLESEFMGAGMDYDAAHAAALNQAGVSPYSLYHPDVIQQFPEYFNSNWNEFWGLK